MISFSVKIQENKGFFVFRRRFIAQYDLQAFQKIRIHTRLPKKEIRSVQECSPGITKISAKVVSMYLYKTVSAQLLLP